MSKRVKVAISAYGPTECGSIEQEKRKFYTLLEDVISSCSRKFPLYICGDFNARVGPSDGVVVGPCTMLSESQPNCNGDLLRHVAASKGFICSSTFFAPSQAKKATWKSSAGKSPRTGLVLITSSPSTI